MTRSFTRRTLLRSAAAIAAGIPAFRPFRGPVFAGQQVDREPIFVSAIVTAYHTNSHADVIVGKILDGFDQQGGAGPKLKLAALYVDQIRKNDLSRQLAQQHNFRMAATVDEALTLGTDQLQVGGVLCIGEHGDYPEVPRTRQRMYPRRRFFDEVLQSFHRVGAVVPVFNDKHLSYRWGDAKSMFDRAAEMRIPLMAGSSLPVAWRRPPVTLPLGCAIDAALAVGYGGLESYGFHALEALQCMVERRTGGECGVRAIRVWKGDDIRRAAERGEWSTDLFAAVLRTMPNQPQPDLSQLNDQAAVYQLEYRDGLSATVVMANGIAHHFGFAARLGGQSQSIATWFELEDQKPFGHFSYLLKAIEHMVHTGRPAYPAERTLLTTGILDAVMHSLADGGVHRETPELAVAYQPIDWPFANDQRLTNGK